MTKGGVVFEFLSKHSYISYRLINNRNYGKRKRKGNQKVSNKDYQFAN